MTGRSPNLTQKGTSRAGLADSYVRILEVVCSVSDFHEAARLVLQEVSNATGCEAVGMRVRDQKGDYPYFEYSGFDERFVEMETRLCHRGETGRVQHDKRGRPILECICGLVLTAKDVSTAPFFTEGGAFWTNSTTELLAQGSVGNLPTTTRNTCNIWGYESVALVPIYAADEAVGLLQCNSKKQDRFDHETIDFLERTGRHLGMAVSAFWQRRETSALTAETESGRSGLDTLMAVGEVASVIAHELKTPLAGLMLSATRLKKALQGDPKAAPILDLLVSSVQSLDGAVKSVLGSFRNPKPQSEAVDVNDILGKTVPVIAPAASVKNVYISWDLTPEPPQIQADARLLSRALLNLLTNALDAVPEGGTVYLTTRKTSDGVEVVVADTGGGIEAQHAARLFEPFFTTKEHGTGLGLCIVKRIVDLHSGTVNLRPRQGGGTEAVVTLPAAESTRPKRGDR